jgi:hypothetical protein
MPAYGTKDWIAEQARRVRQWGDKLTSMGQERWAKMVFDWIPDGRRSRGHPRLRWADQWENLMLSPGGDT